MHWTTGTLARTGITAQVVKTALAAGLSWWLGALVLGNPRPYFGPLAAILTVQVTIAESVSRGGQRILGVVGGIAISLLMVHWLGLSAWSVGILVLLGMAAATALGFGPQAVSQVAISALLVMALGAKPTYAADRLLDTILGALVALAVNAFVIPPDATPSAQHHIRDLSRALAATLRRLSEAVEHHDAASPEMEAARSLSMRVEETRRAIKTARESLLYSPLVKRRRRHLTRLGDALVMLERASIQIRGLARSLARLEDSESPYAPQLAHQLRQMGDAVDVFGRLAASPSAGHQEDLVQAIRKAREGEREGLSWLPDLKEPMAVREIGSVLADLAKMTQDLSQAAAALLPESEGGRKLTGVES